MADILAKEIMIVWHRKALYAFFVFKYVIDTTQHYIYILVGIGGTER